MGRKRKYHSQEERDEAKRKAWRRWYNRNKESFNEKRMKNYYEEKDKKSKS